MFDPKQRQFLSTLATLLAKMAQADGVVTGDEVAVTGAIWHRLGLSPEQSLYCMEVFKNAVDAEGTLEEYAAEYVSSAYGSSTRSLLYELMWDVACADGVLHRNEARALKSLVGWLNVRKDSYAIFYAKNVAQGGKVIDEEVEAQRRLAEAKRRAQAARERRAAAERERKAREEAERKAREQAEAAERRAREWMAREEERRKTERERKRKQAAEERKRRERERKEREEAYRKTPLGHAYYVLGCSPDDPDEKLKKAYRTLAMKNHPDVMAREGVSPEIIARCNKKMAEINSAWDLIRKVRGL